eukprot:TRINITY_DN1855_c0_g1_i2.p1 TRINITY_DN1855_c0_g1~~TRINITY_DN1855_c0_g1_i2.p1  ORF type:complete len:535 (+),score=94.14 TRINITY_DN1855_c0_g1_i2:151-1605(+)
MSVGAGSVSPASSLGRQGPPPRALGQSPSSAAAPMAHFDPRKLTAGEEDDLLEQILGDLAGADGDDQPVSAAQEEALLELILEELLSSDDGGSTAPGDSEFGLDDASLDVDTLLANITVVAEGRGDRGDRDGGPVSSKRPSPSPAAARIKAPRTAQPPRSKVVRDGADHPLLQRLEAQHAETTHEVEVALAEQRRHVNALRRQYGTGHPSYQEARGALKAACRAELDVLTSVTEGNADATMRDMRPVLAGVLAALRMERAVHEAFFNVLSRDVRQLVRKLMDVQSTAAYSMASGMPLGQALCGVCRTPLCEPVECSAFKCMHAFHRECLYNSIEQRYVDVCVLCVGRKHKTKVAGASRPRARSASPGLSPPASAAARKARDAVRRKLMDLHRPEARQLLIRKKSLDVGLARTPSPAPERDVAHRVQLHLAPSRWCVDADDPHSDDDDDFGLSGEQQRFAFNFSAAAAPSTPQHAERLESALWGL